MGRNVWDDLFNEDLLAGLNEKLRSAQRVADRQAFGIPRAEGVVEFRDLMMSVKHEVEALLMRVEACEPRNTRILKGEKLEEDHSPPDVCRASKRMHRSRH